MHTDQFQHNNLFLTDDSFIDENIIQFCNDFFNNSDVIIGQTSGSTGTPKEIILKKSAMKYSAQHTINYFGLDNNSIALLCLPAKYIAGRMMLVRAFVSGMAVHSVEPSINPLLNITTNNFDFAAFTPAQVIKILNDEKSAVVFSNIKNVIIGGAAIDFELEKQLYSFSNNIYVTYGMTETVSHIALRRIGEQSYEKISSQTIIGIDSENCLWIKDENLSPDVLQTNDVVNLIDENNFVWLGRRDFVINSGGIKLHPEQIEQKIRTLYDWTDLNFFVSKSSDSQFGERPILIIEKAIHLPNLEELKSVLNKIEMPDKMHEVENFIYTENGKLNRAETVKLIIEI